MTSKTVDFLVLGRGFAGTAVALTLEKANLSYIILADEMADSASAKAVGLVNPVTGRRMAKSWNWDEIITISSAFYEDVYELIFSAPGTFLLPRPIYKALFSTEEMNFLSAKSSENGYGDLLEIFTMEQKPYPAIFKGMKAWTEIKTGGRLDPNFYLQSTKSFFERNGNFRNSSFKIEELIRQKDSWIYLDIEAKHIISCLGMGCPWMNDKMWPNKGQVFEIEGIPNWGNEVLKTDVFLVPTENNKIFMGSTYEREYEHENVDEAGWNEVTKDIAPEWLSKIEVSRSWAGLRPTTKDRRPIIEKIEDNLFSVNGLGTKGASLAPYAAKVLMEKYFNEYVK